MENVKIVRLFDGLDKKQYKLLVCQRGLTCSHTLREVASLSFSRQDL